MSNESAEMSGSPDTRTKAAADLADRYRCNKQGAAMRSASVAEYDIADAQPLSRKGRT